MVYFCDVKLIHAGRFIIASSVEIRKKWLFIRADNGQPIPRSGCMIYLTNTVMTAKIINAGIAAIAHLTIKTTIDQNGIFISVIITSFLVNTPDYLIRSCVSAYG